MSFRRLRTGDKFVEDHKKYKEWLGKSTADRQTLYDGLNVARFTYTKQDIYVAPFAFAARNLYVPCKAPATGQPAPCPTILGLLAGYFVIAAPTTAGVTIFRPGQYRLENLAKLTLRLRGTAATTKDASRITGAKYYRHPTNSVSMPFGKKADTDTYESVVKTIIALPAYDTFNTPKGNTIGFIPED